MKKLLAFAFTFGIAVCPCIASAQDAEQAGQRRVAPAGEPAIDPAVIEKLKQTMEFMKVEASLGRLVRGAPYSGEGLTTTTQTLSDGTRIERTTRARFYRDSEGRTRREQTILGLGALGETQTITIVDPVAGVTFTLNPATRQAFRSAIPSRRMERGVVVIAPGGDGPPPPPPPPPPPGGGEARGGAPGIGLGARGRGNVANMPESLGTKQMEGVTVTGTKRTEVIPAGRIGNDRPIEITDERWESPDLQVLVMSKHHDPRTGDVEYRLTNIVRADPPRELFMAPPDYTIADAPPPPPAAPRRPE